MEDLVVVLLNFRSVRNKETVIQEYLANHDPDVILGTETWLQQDDPTNLYLPPNYTYIRRDRGSRGGGVLVAAKLHLNPRFLFESPVGSIADFTACAITTAWGPLLLCAIYRPHSDPSCFKLLHDCLQGYGATDKNILIGGDLNLPSLNWDTLSHAEDAGLVDDMVLLMDRYNLTQRVRVPTRVAANTASILDVVLTNLPHSHTISIDDGVSDHLGVCVSLHGLTHVKTLSKKLIYDYRAANLDQLQRDLYCRFINFLDKSDSLSVEELWGCYRDDLLGVIDVHVRKKLVKQNVQQPWIGPFLERQMRRRRRMLTRWRKAPTAAAQCALKTLGREIRTLLRESKKKFLDSLSLHQPQKLWKYVNGLIREPVKIPDLVDGTGLSVATERGKADLLNSHFKSVFSKTTSAPPPAFTARTPCEISPICISAEGILKLILDMDTKKSIGPDNISGTMLRLTANVSALYLERIFARSLRDRAVPNDWKRAIVVPVHKTGPRNCYKNYRPISLTSLVCKLLEHIVVKHVVAFLTAQKLISDHQFGFRAGASTEFLLIKLVHFIAQHMQGGGQVDVVAVDFAKAFDKVPHHYLLHKLECYGLGGDIAGWFRDFLSGRTQCVKIGDSLSGWLDVSSGVPQGSVSGPLLFLLYINDVIGAVSCGSLLFADDLTLYGNIGDDSDCNGLQTDLLAVHEWSRKWLMEVNWSKTHVCTFTRARDRVTSHFCYSAPDREVPRADHIKLLGVVLSADMSWSHHVREVVAKASRRLHLVRVISRGLPAASSLALSCSLIRSVLEYAAAVWDPPLGRDIGILENLQRRYVRLATKNYGRDVCVTNLVASNGLDPLQSRRRFRRLELLFQIFRGEALYELVDFGYLPSYPPTRGSAGKMGRLTCRTGYFFASFFPKTIRDWNGLPESCRASATKAVFANSIRALEPRVACAHHDVP